MKTEGMIPATAFCLHHKVELSFIHSLKESGLIEMTMIEEDSFIPPDQLPALERMIRLKEMDINLEGIETIHHLLKLLQQQQEKNIQLINRLRNYLSDEEINNIQ